VKVPNRAKYLTKRKEQSVARVWASFINGYEKSPDTLFCFYEGKDDKLFYNPRIRSVVFNNQDENIKSDWCDGKDNVLFLLKLLESHPKYTDSWTAFFVDRDYDPIPENNARLYVTPCYSFENLYVTSSTLSKILSDEFDIPTDDDEHTQTLFLFEECLLQFHQRMHDIHAWVLCQRQKEREFAKGYPLNLQEHKPSALINVKISGVEQKQSLPEFQQNFSKAYTITDEELLVGKKEISERGFVISARGKYIIYFFEEFLKLLVEDRRQKDEKRVHFKRKGKVSLTISQGNILSAITQYADMPECLHKFLTELKNKRFPQAPLFNQPN